MRVPIILSPRRLASSMKDVPWWGQAVALAAGAGVLLLAIFVADAFYALVVLMLLFFVAVRLADRRYQRSRR